MKENATSSTTRPHARELLPCPFCGGEADTNLSMREPFVLCKTCHASSALFPTLNDAKAAWNRRTPEAK